MTDDFAGYTCWDEKTVQSLIQSDIGLINEGEEYRFLAVHNPMDIEDKQFLLGGGKKTEQEVLEFWRDQIDEAGENSGNRIIAVTGDPGGGKSHLVRWLYVQTGSSPQEDCEFIYVPRKATGVRVFLNRILDRLEKIGSAEAKVVRRNLERAMPSDVEPEQFRYRFQKALTEALRFGTFTIPEDAYNPDFVLGKLEGSQTGERTGGLADLIRDYEFFREENSVIGRIVKSLIDPSETGEGDENLPEFTESDVKVPPGRRSDYPKDMNAYISNMARDKRSREFAATCLNLATKQASAEALGLRGSGGPSLKDVFFEVRKILKKQGY